MLHGYLQGLQKFIHYLYTIRILLRIPRLKSSVADSGCLSQIRIFPSRIQGQKDSESRIMIRSKKLKYFFQKIVSKFLEI